MTKEETKDKMINDFIAAILNEDSFSKNVIYTRLKKELEYEELLEVYKLLPWDLYELGMMQ